MIKEINSKKKNVNTVRMLKEALLRAESGDIQSLVMFGSDSKGNTFNQINIDGHVMPILGEAILVERDIVDLYCDIRKSVAWEFCE